MTACIAMYNIGSTVSENSNKKFKSNNVNNNNTNNSSNVTPSADTSTNTPELGDNNDEPMTMTTNTATSTSTDNLKKESSSSDSSPSPSASAAISPTPQPNSPQESSTHNNTENNNEHNKELDHDNTTNNNGLNTNSNNNNNNNKNTKTTETPSTPSKTNSNNSNNDNDNDNDNNNSNNNAESNMASTSSSTAVAPAASTSTSKSTGPTSSTPAALTSTTTSTSNNTNTNTNTNSNTTTTSTNNATASTATVQKPPLPVLKGTLSYNIEQRRHNIRGNWCYENTNAVPKQRFEYLRNLSADEDVTTLPLDGEYHGSFNVHHVHTNAKGKRKERTAIINESGVQIKFIKKEEGLYDVKGEGRNDYGTFEIFGTATKSMNHEGGDDQQLVYDIVLKKKYSSSTLPVSSSSSEKKKSKKSLKRKHVMLDLDATPPPPSKSYPKDVVCLKGHLSRITEPEEHGGIGGPQVIHRIQGMWSGGLDKLLEDPDNSKGLCNPFDYEHRCSGFSDVFPLSGRYTGWFLLNKENGEKVTVQEKDVTLKFKMNSEKYYNVEGRGQNGFGKYTITGTLNGHDLTIFRHFHPVKTKVRHSHGGTNPNANANANPSNSASNNASNKHPKLLMGTSSSGTGGAGTSGSGGLSAPKLPIRHKNSQHLTSASSSNQNQNQSSAHEKKLTLDDVTAPDPSEDVAAMKPLENGAFSVLHRGVLKIDPDGQHSCTGKWAISREQFEEKKSSSFMFGLKSNDAILAAKRQKGIADDKDTSDTNNGPLSPTKEHADNYNPIVPDLSSFPLDSDVYYGQFRMKRGNSSTTVRDQQIVLKFRKNSVGSYNIYGMGTNDIGTFDLLGTLVPRGEGSGLIELYRIYHPIATASSATSGGGTGTGTGSGTGSGGGKQLLTPTELNSAKKLNSNSSIMSNKALTKTKSSLDDSDDDSDGDTDHVPTILPTFSADLPTSSSNSILPKSGFHVPSLSNSSSISPLISQTSSGMMQRSSSRTVKVPSRLEEDNPKALQARLMDKCSQILRFLLEKDAFAFFAQPVDPLALGIPTYHQVIQNPMDLGTIQKQLSSGQIETHQQFGSLVRLVFHNAMTFNVDVTHRVHQNARDMLAFFNQKFKEVEQQGEKLEEFLRNDKKSSKKREKEASKEARKKQKEEQKKKRKMDGNSSQTNQDNTASSKNKSSSSTSKNKSSSSASKSKSDSEFVSRAEFDAVVNDLRSMKKMLELIVTQFASSGVKLELPPEEDTHHRHMSGGSVLEDMPTPKKSKSSSSSSKPKSSSSSSNTKKETVETPLTREEQIELTETINDLPEDKLQGVMDILREDMDVLGDDEEIDLEIDALKTSTQRKLQRYVRQKKPKSKPAKKAKSSTSSHTNNTAPTPHKKSDSSITSSSKKKAEPSMLDSDDSDSDSDDDPPIASMINNTTASAAPKDDNEHENNKPAAPKKKAAKEDNIFGKQDSDNDSDSDSEFDGNFNFDDFKTHDDKLDGSDNDDDDSDNDSEDGNDAYAKARKMAASEHTRAEKRAQMEQKVRQQSELAHKQKLKEQAAKHEKAMEQRKLQEKEEARLEEEKKKEAEEARKKARDELRKQRDDTKQECDLDEERKLMMDYEFNYGGGNSGSNSPSSDFGF